VHAIANSDPMHQVHHGGAAFLYFHDGLSMSMSSSCMHPGSCRDDVTARRVEPLHHVWWLGKLARHVQIAPGLSSCSFFLATDAPADTPATSFRQAAKGSLKVSHLVGHWKVLKEGIGNEKKQTWQKCKGKKNMSHPRKKGPHNN
jgi:hypothetical protein